MRRALMLTTAMFWLAASATAQPLGLPPGKWWHLPGVVERLELSTDQQDRLDAIFRRSAPELIDLKADVEKKAIALRGELDRTELDAGAVAAAASRLNEARGALFNRELMLLVEMRSVLQDPQWRKLRHALEQRQRPQTPHRNQQRPRDRKRPR